MGTLIATQLLNQQNQLASPEGLSAPLSADDCLQVYNGLDCCLTLEIFEELSRVHPAELESKIYSFSRALQGPYMSIMQRGFAVDIDARTRALRDLDIRTGKLQKIINTLSQAVCDKDLNIASTTQLRVLFYSHMQFPEVFVAHKGERKISTNREALEKLEQYLYARPFVMAILAMRDIAKQAEVFRTEIDADGRFRAAYNIAGTETGRPSSSANAFGSARNAQNIAAGLRHVFVADPGYKMAVVDLEQVEARDVGYLCGCLFDDWSYLDACESGDVHTANARLIWPDLPWGTDVKQNRQIADRSFYREMSFRDMAKRGGHATNYMMSPFTMSRSLKIPTSVAEDFQARYCKGPNSAYPVITKYWQWVAEQLQTVHYLVNPFGRKRIFFGRPSDATTLREAVAYLPQSTTAERMNLAMWRVWEHVPEVELLAQTYDSITFQYKETLDEASVLGKVLQMLQVELVAPNGRRYCVPGEAKVGWNWGYKTDGPKGNALGLQKWAPNKLDTRTR